MPCTQNAACFWISKIIEGISRTKVEISRITAGISRLAVGINRIIAGCLILGRYMKSASLCFDPFKMSPNGKSNHFEVLSECSSKGVLNVKSVQRSLLICKPTLLDLLKVCTLYLET